MAKEKPKEIFVNGLYPQKVKIETNKGVPYMSKCSFYKIGTTIVPVVKELVGKGWWTVCVGKYKGKVRDDWRAEQLISKMLHAFYPGASEKVSLFQSLSYHRGESGKVSKYGLKPYNLQFTRRIPQKRYTLASPIKSELKAKFGEVVKSVELYKWIFVVLNWRPMGKGKPVKLYVERKVMLPNDKEEVLFKSKEFDEKDAKKAIAIFQEEVEKAKKQK